MSELEIDELIPCISGGCFHGGGCIYWQSVEDGKVDYKKLHELAKTKLTQLLESERVKAKRELLEQVGEAYTNEPDTFRIWLHHYDKQLQTPKDKGDSDA